MTNFSSDDSIFFLLNWYVAVPLYANGFLSDTVVHVELVELVSHDVPDVDCMDDIDEDVEGTLVYWLSSLQLHVTHFFRKSPVFFILVCFCCW